MKIFDLHCDTVYECLIQEKSLLKNNLALDARRISLYDEYIQTFAFWIDDKYRGESAYNHFLSQYELFCTQIEKSDGKLKLWDTKPTSEQGSKALLAIESGAVLGGKIQRVEELKKRNIKIMTICWNADNELASGVNGIGGFTSFGKDVVREMENCDITVDVSHLNEISFFDLCNFAKKPFIASHSNAYDVHDNRRNLKKEQITEIKNINGLIGLNFYKNFIGGEAGFDDISRHIDCFLELGCENILALGSDFDGAVTSNYFKDVFCMENFYNDTSNRFGKDITNKIFYENAYNFFRLDI